MVQTNRQAGAKDELTVEVTPAMERAGLVELHDVGFADLGYLVRSIYRAMEYERLDEGR